MGSCRGWKTHQKVLGWSTSHHVGQQIHYLGAAIPKTPHPTHAHKMIMGSCLLFCR